MARLLFLLLIFRSAVSFAQPSAFNGMVSDEKGNPISYATIVLLEPSDSTLAFYAITNSEGNFEIKNVSSGSFILQSSYLGYKTYYQTIQFPREKEDFPVAIVMEPKPISLPDADINAERIPILIRGDTVEYAAASFKTKPDAVVEDLLKKLPGIVVDRAGNIKAQGEEVKKVTVDGKEFFGNDPKIATRNLPADAINKVQVFDTKSDQAELTGINDGKRDKTINVELKDDKKSAWFGELQAGVGSAKLYQSGAKAYRFTPEKQFAFLGMLNNINKFGFSFSDYMNFNGGFRGNGESFKISSDNNSFPIDFGNTEYGLIESGAVGVNYSSEVRKDNRFNISYLANGINKKQNRAEASTNFTGHDPFYSNQNSYTSEKNRAHRVNFGWKNRIDSMQTFNINGQGSVNNNSESNFSSLFNSINNSKVSDQKSENELTGNSVNVSLHSSFLKKMNSKWKLLSFEFDGLILYGLSENEIKSLAKYHSPPMELMFNQSQKNKTDVINYSADAGILRKIGGFTYLSGNISAGVEDELFSRQQGLVAVSDELIDSLSGALKKSYHWIEPKIKIKRINEKSQLGFSLAAKMVNVKNNFDGTGDFNLNKLYFLPTVSWENEYKSSHRFRLIYETSVVAPKSTEFFPVTNYFNSLNLFSGNQSLKPEVHNDFRFHWSVFDQFTFTSIFTGLRLSYIKDKISWNKTINNNLVQSTTLLNVPKDYQIGFNADYSTPIRKLGININLSIDESWIKTFAYINGILSKSSRLIHELGISFDNRKKNKWEISAGINVKKTQSLISLSSIPGQSYISGSAFADIGFIPAPSWHFSVKVDLTQYYDKTFNNEIYIPLLQAEASYSFLKHKKGKLLLSAFDILNRNTGVYRMSEYNYLLESRSDIIQRYFMFTFRYKLNKFSDKDKIDIKMNGR